MVSHARAVGIVLTAIALVSAATYAEDAPKFDPELTAAVNASLGTSSSTLVNIGGPMTPGQRLNVELSIDEVGYQLDLRPYSVRAGNYRLLMDNGDGVVDVEPGPVRTMRGEIFRAGGTEPVGVAAGSLMRGGLYARLKFADAINDETDFWVEPIKQYVDGGGHDGIHVVYRSRDVGVDPDRAMDSLGQEAKAHFEVEAVEGGCPDTYWAQMAFDSDCFFTGIWGEDVEARINLIVNLMNIQFDTDVDVNHRISAVVVRCCLPFIHYGTPGPDILIHSFRQEWLIYHSDIERDVTHLFTGMDLDGPAPGVAFFTGAVCTDNAYSVTQNDFVLACETDHLAHELGHLWGASDCDCPGFTMNSVSSCANEFSGASQAAIIAHRNRRDCLDCTPPGGGGYCGAAGTVAGGEFVQRVELRDIDQSSASGLYSDFSGVHTLLAAGEAALVKVTLGNAEPEDIAGLWIDWNQDLDFNDAFEKITDSWSGPGPHLALVVVPETAPIGMTRMRVRVQDGSPDPDLLPCGASTFGEVEDYSILVSDGPPPNDECADAIVVGDGHTVFSNVEASTDGPDEIVDCEFSGYSHLESDVWFRYVPSCDGLATAAACAVDFDAKMAVYSQCPTEASIDTIACGDDACGTGPIVDFFVVEGESYLIRIGGYEGDQGSGILDIMCQAPEPECPADLDGSGTVSFADLLLVISAWGPCAGCDEDLDGDGSVGLTDLLTVLSAWGDC